MEKATSNIITLLRKQKEFRDMKIDDLQKMVEIIQENFILTPNYDKSQKTKVFHNMKFKFMREALTDDEVEIYDQIWDYTWQAWGQLTDEPIGPYEGIEMDHAIFAFIERRRLAIASRGRKLDITIGSPGWIAGQILERALRTISEFWPRKRPAPKAKKENKADEAKPEVEKIPIYLYDDLVMTQEEYDEWYDGLENKADIAGHVKSEMIDPATLADRKASK